MSPASLLSLTSSMGMSFLIHQARISADEFLSLQREVVFLPYKPSLKLGSCTRIMKQRLSVDVPLEQIEAFCRKWEISDLSLFGSVLREDFRPDSDIDALVQFVPEAKHGLFNLVRMRNELEEIFGRDVDLISRRGVEASRNPIRRKAILDSARTIYAAAR